MASTLTRWLGTLRKPELAALLARRPETLVPAPRNLGELASRLQARLGVLAALQTVPRPALQALETTRGYHCRTRAELAAQLGLPAAEAGGRPGGARLDAALRPLAEQGLLWEYDGQLGYAGEVAAALGYPLGLGLPAAELIAGRPAGELRGYAEALDLTGAGAKPDVLADLTEFFADPHRLRAVLDGAPARTRALLDSLAWHGPLLRNVDFGYVPGVGPRYTGPGSWAAQRGLLCPDGWQQLAMPREVALALRGPDWRPPFDPEPPVPNLVEVDPAAADRESGLAAGDAVEQVGALLSGGPVALVKTGGVGIREQRRLARELHTDPPMVRLWLELAQAAGLLLDESRRHSAGGAGGQQVLPTEAFDQWLVEEPAQRVLPLLVGWYGLAALPLLEEWTPLVRVADGRLAVDLRMELLGLLATLPAGQRLADPAQLIDLLTWRRPVLAQAIEGLPGLMESLWREAVAIGAIAHGALTSLGRALVALDAAELSRLAGELLDRTTSTAIFQGDLTALVAGTPSVALQQLLDSVADREARGAASTWRFSPGSVRRALDAGGTAERLLAGLRAATNGGTLPQPLEYLIFDVSRRHGTLRVRTAGCVLHADDPALLAELVAARALAPLGLAALAPTVLTSREPMATTLAALRTAGYLPVGEDQSGVPVIEVPQRRRAPDSADLAPHWADVDGSRPRRGPVPADPARLADILLDQYSAPDPRSAAGQSTPLW